MNVLSNLLTVTNRCRDYKELKVKTSAIKMNIVCL